MADKIKVVWLCNFSNPFVLDKLDLGFTWLQEMMRKMAHKSLNADVPEFANWVSNGICEFEKIDEVELHVVSPHPYMKQKKQEFFSNGIYYHFFRNEEDDICRLLYMRVIKPKYWAYKKNRQVIADFIGNIQPDVVHLFGAENPYYSLGILDVPKSIVVIAQLQTLMNDPDFQNNYPISPRLYQYKVSVEKKIIEKVDFLATRSVKFRNIILKDIRPDATILNTGLALQEPIVKDVTEKEFDFVYFSANLNKAADLAFEAFGRAYQQRPELTLDIIGECDESFRQVLDEIIHRYGMEKALCFEGMLPSHNDVLMQIRKSRYALLPLKIDLTSGTIREAMSNGLPVLTTDTGELGTLKLNADSQCVLISKTGDHQALAENILRLIDDGELAKQLIQNSYQLRSAGISNKEKTRRYVDAYKACMDFKNGGIPISEELTKV